MSVTVVKMYFQKQGPMVIHYRDYKSFNTHIFRQGAFANLHEENVNINQQEKFRNVFKKNASYSCTYKKALHKGKSGHIYEQNTSKSSDDTL